jgi:hypothetical protein
MARLLFMGSFPLVRLGAGSIWMNLDSRRVGSSEDRPPEQGGEHRRDQDSDDGLVVQGAVGEGKSGDEQRDREADAGQGGAAERLPEPDAGREPTRTDTHARP